MPPAGRGPVPCTPCTSFLLTPLRTASSGPSRAGQGLSVVRPSQASFASRPSNGQRATLCPKLKAGKHYEASEEVPADLAGPRRNATSSKNASGGQGTRPLHPIHLFLPPLPLRLKRSVAGRARAVGCSTEPGIVCFPAVSWTTRRPLPEAQGREALRGQRGSSDRPCPACDGSRLRTKPPKRKIPAKAGILRTHGTRQIDVLPLP